MASALRPIAAVVILAAHCLGCDDASGEPEPIQGADRVRAPAHETTTRDGSEESMAFTLRSTAFQHNGVIPRRFTCEGEDLSPPLSWTELPKHTRSLALIVDDPDAPDPSDPRTTFVHWVVFNIDPGLGELEEGASGNLPRGASQGVNDWKRAAYGGPCPPVGDHRYFFKLYALDTKLDLQNPTKARLLEAMQDHVLAKAELVGRYQKQAVTSP